MEKYESFLNNKRKYHRETGFEAVDNNFIEQIKPFQKYLVKRALKVGKFAILSDTGTGKTLMQLQWANLVAKENSMSVLILCPLAVSKQTINEAIKFGLMCEKLSTNENEQIVQLQKVGVYISNYEQLNNIDCSKFSGVVLDESSILKNFNGATKTLIIDKFKNTPYKLACTALMSPNDDLEIGNHAEFLNVMSSKDMRSIFFTTEKNRAEGNKYRLKRHGIDDFFAWVNSWACMIKDPSDIGFDSEGYVLPKMNIIERQVDVEMSDINGSQLFKDNRVSATVFNAELRDSTEQRMNEVANIVNNEKPNETFLIWVNIDVEAELLLKLIPDAIEVSGKQTLEIKEKRLHGFANNEFRVLITKKKIAQYGLNFQYVKNANMIFASLDFSFEGMYQSMRRMYRFGQKNEVNIYMITIATMENVKHTLEEKERNFNRLRTTMVKMMNKNKKYELKDIERKEFKSDKCLVVQGDSTQLIDELEDNSIDFTFFSPPFSNMYVFSNALQDLSNCTDYNEFMTHFEFLIPKLYAKMRSGRMVAMHIMQTTSLKGDDGYYSIKDFRGDVIRLFEKYGFFFHAETTIRKDPQLAAVRTKNHQLMWGTTKKNSLVNRPGLADYIIVMRKDEQVDTERPVCRNLPFDKWCLYAEPIWDDINESDTLKFRLAQGQGDERHITATQLEPIKRLLMMYTNEGDTCYTPYSGSGSELFQYLTYGCKAVAHELKESYFNQSVNIAKECLQNMKQAILNFDTLE